MGLRLAKFGVGGTSKGLWLGASGFWGHPVSLTNSLRHKAPQSP